MGSVRIQYDSGALSDVAQSLGLTEAETAAALAAVINRGDGMSGLPDSIRCIRPKKRKTETANTNKINLKKTKTKERNNK